jgi:LacI family transcriptional regulator
MAPKRITMEQIAREAQVSRTTVSFVLNKTANTNISEATRLRVLETAFQLGYYAPTTQETNFIAFVMHQTSDQIAQDALLGEVLRGVTNAIEPFGYHVGLFPLPVGNVLHYLDLIITRRPRGIIVSGPIEKDTESLYVLAQQNIPVVIQGQLENPLIYCVDVENVYSARLAMRHLLELGHRRIAFITNAPISYTASSDRLKGYQQALAEYETPFQEVLVRYGQFTSMSGYNAMLDLLNTNPEPPSAVFVASDVVALGAMQAARQWGLQIPEDVSFVGFDDMPLAAYLYPPLTTVRIPAGDLGYHAGQLLMGLAHGESALPRRTLLDSQLKVRGSTRPYRAR